MKKPTITGGDLTPKATSRGLELLPQVAKALLTHASQDPLRVAIHGLGIDGTGEAAWLCATDGIRLIRMPIAGTVPPGVATCLSAEEIGKAIKRAEAGDVRGTGESGATLIVITHKPALAALADVTITLDHGRTLMPSCTDCAP